MNINIEYKKKKVFLSEKFVPWEHEQFSKKKILAATFSSNENPPMNNFNRTSLMDTSINKEILKRNIKLIAETLLGFLFEFSNQNITIFRDEDSIIDNLHIDYLVDYFGKVSRTPLNIQKGSQINSYLYSFISSYLQKPLRQSVEYKEQRFFDTNSGVIKIYTVKSKLIDLYILVTILVYLLLLYIYTKGLRKFIAGVRSFFSDEE